MRLRRDGPNALPGAARRSLLRLVFDVVREPMFALLLGAGALYLVLGDLAEALLLLAFALLSVGIAVVQEARTERALDALRDLSSPRALVVRDGVRQRIAGGRWCGATCCCWLRATGYRPMRCWSGRRSWRSMNPC